MRQNHTELDNAVKELDPATGEIKTHANADVAEVAPSNVVDASGKADEAPPAEAPDKLAEAPDKPAEALAASIGASDKLAVNFRLLSSIIFWKI